jgi:mono/diheme cytochrome c family protein
MKTLIYILLLIMGATRTSLAFTLEDSTQYFIDGRETFRSHCSVCHSVHKEIVGPALGSITKKRSEQWLISFIRNSQAVITSDDDYAKFVYKQFNQTVMPAFHELSENEMQEILYYLKRESLYPEEPVRNEVDILNCYNAKVLSGKKIFQNQCANCHYLQKENEREGPALGSVTKRRPRPWLMAFIKNSQHVIKSGDPYAVGLYNAFDKRIMVPMEFLSDQDINSILDYIEFASLHADDVHEKKISTVVNAQPDHIQKPETNNGKFFKIFFIMVTSAAAIIHAYLVIKFFNYLRQEKQG